MTAHAMRGDREACLNAGMDSYVSKPLDAEVLLKTLEGLVSDPDTAAGSFLSLFTKSGMWRFRNPAGPSDPLLKVANMSGLSDSLESTKSVWDVDVALKRMGGDTTILESMVDYFFEDSPVLLQQLQGCLESGDIPEATRVAHSLKGLCANFEATQAVECAGKIEAACRENRVSEASLLLSRLQPAVQQLSAALSEWRSEMS